ncbi:MAG TPA: hypothetical protein VF824_18790 [Thermoanaerobaculia bacterium]|jgi:hypothetical protein
MIPLTRRQSRIILLLTIVIGLTRLVAIARAPFDWDEGLFMLGVRDYDVGSHHPHPPGYPLFIAAAKVLHAIGVPEFRALQVVVLLGAIALFPALFALARELGLSFATAAGGAAVYAFLPNVWIYGGTAFSDIPAAALGFTACALLLRGRRERRAYLVGALVLGVAAGFRPPMLVAGAVPALLATWSRLRAGAWRDVALAVIGGAGIVALAYGGAALASSSVENYIGATRAQSQWVHDIDSWHNPGRAPLHEVAKLFFLWPIQQKQQFIGLDALAIIALLAAAIRRDAAPWLLVVLFLPLAIMTWLNLDVEAAGRYALPYLAVHALLAAEALGVLAVRRPSIQLALCAAVSIVFLVWAWPGVRLQRRSDPPPVAALEWVKRNVPRDALLYVNGGIGPISEAVMGDRAKTYYDSIEQVSLLRGDAWLVDLRVQPGAQNFVWPRKQLWKVLRRRNFEASVSRVSSRIVVGEGWYGEEGGDANPFRWMSHESKTTLPSFHGNGKLYLRMYVPVDTLGTPPQIEVWLNGALVERFAGTNAITEKSWTLTSRENATNELRITTSAVVNPAKLGRSGDTRDLGLRIDALSWTAVR